MDDYVKARVDEASSLLQSGNLTSAYFALRKALRREPDNAAALLLKADWCLRSGRRAESEDLVTALLEMNPGSFDTAAKRSLAHLCFDNELHAPAIDVYEMLRQDEAHDALSLYRTGICLRRLGRMNEAESVLLESLTLSPRAASPHMQLGHVYKSMGDTNRAAQHYRKFIELTSADKGMGYWCLADLKSYAFSAEDIHNMERDLELLADAPAQQSATYFALGWAAEKNKDYATAIENYGRANRIQAALKPFDAGQYRRFVSGLCEAPPHETGIPDGDGPVAILVVGLPRSGSTLIEHILSAHSRVQATDELPFLEEIAFRLEGNGGYPARLASMTRDEQVVLRQRYLDGVSTYLPAHSDYFIDKYPGNFLHIGLVKRILPDAIIVDVRRDPRDVAISAYRQLFNVRNEFAASFDGIYEYYKGYLAIMEHWKSVYPDEILTLGYEALVSSPEEGIRALLGFCGLEVEAGCLEYYRQERTVQTPSVGQVSKPMYTSSIGYWRNFAELIPEEMQRLGTLIAPA